MKRTIALLLALMLLFAFAACGDTETDAPETTEDTKATDATNSTEPPQEETAAVYIPESVRIEMGDGTVVGPVIYAYEEGWQTKDSFTVTYSTQMQGLTINYTMTFRDKATELTVDMGGTQTKQETYYDENGRLIRAVVYSAAGEYQKTENIYAYDEKGRQISQEVKAYAADDEEPIAGTTLYTIEDTADGSKGTSALGNSVTEMTYDQAGRLISSVTFVDGSEMTRTEYTYDENGCQTAIASYYMGQLTTKTETAYKAVQLSEEKAQQLPQYKRGE